MVWSWVDTPAGKSFEHIHVNHLIAGDTDSAMLKIPEVYASKLTEEELIAKADEVGRRVNQSFPDFVQFAFNCPAVRSDSIKTAREVVADKGFYLSKKRYILHIIDSEGKRVDKMKIQGVEIKKTGTATFTKRILMEIVNMILDGADVHQLNSRIAEFKREYMDTSLLEIANISNCKTLKDAQDYYVAFGELRKGTHYTAKAAIHYNLKCTQYDSPIMPGEKIKLLYCRDVLNVIGFPVDMTTLPEWFNDIIIDRELMWGKVNKTITNYLESMGFDLKSRKAALSRDLFGF
jgi:hypothetical protein